MVRTWPFLWLCWLVPLRASALELDFRAPACASEAAFRERLGAALADGPGKLALHIVQATDGSFALSLRFASEAHTSERELSTETCEEALDAAAVLTTLVLDDAPAVRERDDTQVRHEAAVRITPLIATRVDALLGALPSPGWTFEGALGLAFARSFRVWGQGFASLAERGSVPGRADFGGSLSLRGGALGACFMPELGRVRMGACTSAYGGRMRGRGVGVNSSREQKKAWFAGGARLELDVRIQHRLWLSAQAELLVPFVRTRFYLDELGTVYRPAASAARLGIGLLVELGG